ncbi:NAD(P)/FAD-dependent oxidoreductase [Aestuariispira insulae]|uniref:Amine oxidase domain-containing protein n=1 Tax=Aestuariispira insulae TaxID=1461337 RepID=A0A3D9H8J4_9PROT|nr:FAD-dependent oxidoreductase [Aestuariispira insulae]RED45789.1 hypothetical protein DFP90_11136 [Aestuariispira insulae]
MSQTRRKVAVIGSGIAGLSAAWHLSRHCDVTLVEKDDRLGGHSNTVDTIDGPVDTGFIVYNEKCYPNLVQLFRHLDVKTCETEMSFGVSVNEGALEYAGRDLAGMFAQKSNFVKPAYWKMISDILRFYRNAGMALAQSREGEETLGDYLSRNGYGQMFIQDHIIPMGAAIWSTPANQMLKYPLRSFLVFCENHGLLQLENRPQWRTVVGGSRNYVNRLMEAFSGRVLTDRPVKTVERLADGVHVESHSGWQQRFDDVVLACHADQALAMMKDAGHQERDLLGRFKYQRNRAILHTDESLMPKRRSAWCSWNYLAEGETSDRELCVSYWMNNLQPIAGKRDYFVTLNPIREPRAGSIVRSFLYDHPIYDLDSEKAQHQLWHLQGNGGLWFCGSYFGYGFHEDGIQSGLAVAEAISGIARPWSVPAGSDRVNLPESWLEAWPHKEEAA